MIIRPLKADAEFLRRVLSSPKIVSAIEDASVGTTMVNLNQGTLAGLKIQFPPLPEQRAIATALSDVDTLLDGLERLIAKKRNLKQAAMQQLLTGQTRLPGFSGDWEVKPLKGIVQTPITDGPHLTPQFLENGVPFLSVNNLIDNKIDLGDLRFISQKDHEVFSRKCKPRKNDILLGKAASVGKVAIVELELDFNIWSPIAMIRVSDSHSPRFVYYQLQSADIVRQITLLTNSSSQGNIGMGDIEKLQLALPLLPEQTAIAAVLSDMDAEISALVARRDKTRALKQAMMQELLTGKTRLVSPEVAHA
jgi:type I restriction enzyme S subunit